jgi:hypothetical protein
LLDPARGDTATAGVAVVASGFDRAGPCPLYLRDGRPQDNSAILLRWSRPGAAYRLILAPEGRLLPQTGEILQLQVGSALDSSEPVDVSVQLVDSNGTAVTLPLSRWRSIPPALEARLWKSQALAERYGIGAALPSSRERMLQTFDVAVDDFMALDKEFDGKHIAQVALVADRMPAGGIYLDQIGWAASAATARYP